MKGKALRRALQQDALRVNAEIPLITTTTELITPEVAREMLKKNSNNRPVNWARVDEFAAIMSAGRWRLHDQGIMLDAHDNILTGQKRLWAVVKSGVNVYLRVSRGNPADTATVIDRGVPQSARDLASRDTGRAHSPTEAALARAIGVLDGVLSPTTDQLAVIIATYAAVLPRMLALTRGTKKSREVLMVVAALLHRYRDDAPLEVARIPILVDQLTVALAPRTAAECWGHGAAFSLAMEHARRLVGRT